MNDCFVVTSRIVNRVCATSGKNDTIHAMDEVRKKPVRLTRAGRTAILKALADPRRFELLERIAAASCPMACMDVRDALAVSPATLSHHIKELETAGLIQVRREGKYHYLSLRPAVLDSIIEILNGLKAKACPDRATARI